MVSPSDPSPSRAPEACVIGDLEVTAREAAQWIAASYVAALRGVLAAGRYADSTERRDLIAAAMGAFRDGTITGLRPKLDLMLDSKALAALEIVRAVRDAGLGGERAVDLALTALAMQAEHEVRSEGGIAVIRAKAAARKAECN